MVQRSAIRNGPSTVLYVTAMIRHMSTRHHLLLHSVHHWKALRVDTGILSLRWRTVGCILDSAISGWLTPPVVVKMVEVMHRARHRTNLVTIVR